MALRRACVVLLALVLAGCSLLDGGEQRERPEAGTSGSSESADEPPPEPQWGPSRKDLRRARQLVSKWGADRLAGHLIVAGYAGTDPAAPAALVRDLHLAGIRVGGFNVASEAQVRATTAAIAEAAARDGREFPPVVATDQEGGLVEHLRGVATSYPPFAVAGRAIEQHPASGPRTVREAMAAAARELRDLGFNWNFAPVADVTIGAADVAIGDRSASSDPQLAARTVVAALQGYRDGATVSVIKHYPGHGAVGADSHVSLPRLDASRRQLDRRELVPFRSAVEAGVPAIMLGHLDVTALAPEQPATLARPVYRHLRQEVGFEGIAVTDALEMAAVAGPGVAVRALRAGADVVLMPADPRAAHAEIVAALESGELQRRRVVRSVVKVVALQLWQQRRARAVPVPADATAQAEAAAQRLRDAGS